MIKHHTGELHKKGTILQQAPQITLFLTHTVYIFICVLERMKALLKMKKNHFQPMIFREKLVSFIKIFLKFNIYTLYTLILKTFPGGLLVVLKNVCPIGSTVLTFIGYNQTNIHNEFIYINIVHSKAILNVFYKECWLLCLLTVSGIRL